jgi:hypothetical protein
LILPILASQVARIVDTSFYLAFFAITDLNINKEEGKTRKGEKGPVQNCSEEIQLCSPEIQLELGNQTRAT